MGDEIMQTLHVNKLIKAKQMHYHSFFYTFINQQSSKLLFCFIYTVYTPAQLFSTLLIIAVS